MKKSLLNILQGYHTFREKYTQGDDSVMKNLAEKGQHPEAMVVACSDSRVDPSVILQTAPGDLFIVRNVANIIPPFESDKKHHGTSAALEYGICYLNVKHLIVMGHSQCGGIDGLLNSEQLKQNDFISSWVGLAKTEEKTNVDCASKESLLNSYHNAQSFPWIKERMDNGLLTIHLWFFNIKTGLIEAYDFSKKTFKHLDQADFC